MPPKHTITFVCNNVEISISLYCNKKQLETEGLRKLSSIVTNPLDYKIKL